MQTRPQKNKKADSQEPAFLQRIALSEISEKRIDESVKRQVYWKLRTGVFKRHASSRYPFVQQDEALQKYWKNQSEAEKQQLARLQKDYNNRLNETVSRKGIVSLRKQFEGLNAKPEQTFLFYRTAAAKKQGEELGIPQDRMIFYRTGHTWLFRIYEKQWAGPWIIEIEETDLPLWNLLSGRWKSRREEPLIGLYAGNPFHNIAIPENGAVLCSFSPTFESRQALVYRAFQGPVKQADLILPETR